MPDAEERAAIQATLGAMLRDERAAARLSVARLAALAGVNPRTVDRIERGERRASVSMLGVLAEALVWCPGRAPDQAAARALQERLCAAGGASVVADSPRGPRRLQRRAERLGGSARRAVNRALGQRVLAERERRRAELAALDAEFRRLTRKEM